MLTGTGLYSTIIPNTVLASSLNRFCSADVPEVSALWNSVTGRGTEERVHFAGEEVPSGRAIAAVVRRVVSLQCRSREQSKETST